INPIKVASERHPDKTIREELVKRGYVTGKDIKEPAVKTLNTSLATMAVEVLINQYTDVRRHVPVLVYENNGSMSMYEDRESVQLRNKQCFLCNVCSLPCIISYAWKVSQARQMKEKKALETQRPRQVPRSGSQTWSSIQWRMLEQHVLHIQKGIYRASQSGDRRAVHSLQQQLIESEAARLLAVRWATEENDGKDTAGIDGVKSLTPKERLAMVSTIHPANWSQQPSRPVRRVWLPKPGTAERRPLAILPMIDRCKQALVKLALEPEWEAKFEPHSYGFRPDRGAQDAIRAIMHALKQQSSYVFDADIEAAFDSI